VIDAQLLQRIPGCESGVPPLGLHALPGGRGVNQVLFIATHAGRFVLRRKFEPIARPGADPLQEIAAHRAAAAAGLAPQLVDSAADGSWLLMEYLDGKAWEPADLTRDAAVETLGQQLGRLHRLAPPACMRPFEPLQLAALQRQGVAERWPAQLGVAQALEREVAGVCRELDGSGSRLAVNHGDLQLSNVLGSRALLVDWEYAQLTDPAWDIACLLTYYPFLAARSDLLQEAAGVDPSTGRERLALQRQLFRALDRLWGLANGLAAG